MTPLHVAAAAGSSDIVAMILATPGVDADEKGPVRGHPAHQSPSPAAPFAPLPPPLQWNDRPLHLAAAVGSVPCVQALLQGAPAGTVDVNAAGGTGRATPIHRAAAAGHAGVVELLLATPGVRPNEPDGVRACERASERAATPA